MKQEFENLINNLKNDPKLLISVTDANTLEKVIPARNAEQLTVDYGSVENFFESLFKKGHTKIAVQRYRPQGSGQSKVGNMETFDFSPKNENQNPVPTPTPTPTVSFPALNGTNQAVAIGLGQAMEMAVNASMVGKLEVENQYLKKENQDLRTQIDELKEERLASKYSAENKKQNNELFLGLAQAFGPALQGLISKTPDVGLASPAPQPLNLSEAKQELLDFLMNENTLDAHATFLIQIVEKINHDPSFYNELVALMTNNKQEENE
jgi:hypothetical protein